MNDISGWMWVARQLQGRGANLGEPRKNLPRWARLVSAFFGMCMAVGGFAGIIAFSYLCILLTISGSWGYIFLSVITVPCAFAVMGAGVKIVQTNLRIGKKQN